MQAGKNSKPVIDEVDQPITQLWRPRRCRRLYLSFGFFAIQPGTFPFPVHNRTVTELPAEVQEAARTTQRKRQARTMAISPKHSRYKTMPGWSWQVLIVIMREKR
jgi:hypothetical protein